MCVWADLFRLTGTATTPAGQAHTPGKHLPFKTISNERLWFAPSEHRYFPLGILFCCVFFFFPVSFFFLKNTVRQLSEKYVWALFALILKQGYLASTEIPQIHTFLSHSTRTTLKSTDTTGCLQMIMVLFSCSFPRIFFEEPYFILFFCLLSLVRFPYAHDCLFGVAFYCKRTAKTCVHT